MAEFKNAFKINGKTPSKKAAAKAVKEGKARWVTIRGRRVLIKANGAAAKGSGGSSAKSAAAKKKKRNEELLKSSRNFAIGAGITSGLVGANIKASILRTGAVGLGAIPVAFAATGLGVASSVQNVRREESGFTLFKDEALNTIGQYALSSTIAAGSIFLGSKLKRYGAPLRKAAKAARAAARGKVRVSEKGFSAFKRAKDVRKIGPKLLTGRVERSINIGGKKIRF